MYLLNANVTTALLGFEISTDETSEETHIINCTPRRGRGTRLLKCFGESLTYNSIDVSSLSEEKDTMKDVRKFKLVYNRVIFLNIVKSMQVFLCIKFGLLLCKGHTRNCK